MSRDHEFEGGPEGDGPDPAFERLQAADPAATVTADATALRAAVDRRLAVERLTPPRQRAGWTRWTQIAAAVAGVAVVGSAGFYLGSAGRTDLAVGSTTSVDPATRSVAPAIALDDGGGAAAPIRSGSVDNTSSLPAAGIPPTYQESMSQGKYGGWTQHIRFLGDGLSTEAGTAQGYAYDPAQIVTKANAEKFALIWGLTGEAKANWGWAIGPWDGTARSFLLMNDGFGTVNYSDPTVPVPTDCSSASPGSPGAAQDSIQPDLTSSGAADQDSCIEVTAPPRIADAAATQRMRDLLADFDLDPGTFEYEINPGTDSYLHGQAWSVFAGQRTGQSWSFDFNGDALTNVNGQVAPVVGLGQYKIVSPADALNRLNDSRFGATPSYPADFIWPQPAPVAEGDSTATTVPNLPLSGSPVSWPASQITITSVRLGLAAQTQPGGAAILVPTYQLSESDGVSWSVIAVADDQLDFTP